MKETHSKSSKVCPRFCCCLFAVAMWWVLTEFIQSTNLQSVWITDNVSITSPSSASQVILKYVAKIYHTKLQQNIKHSSFRPAYMHICSPNKSPYQFWKVREGKRKVGLGGKTRKRVSKNWERGANDGKRVKIPSTIQYKISHFIYLWIQFQSFHMVAAILNILMVLHNDMAGWCNHSSCTGRHFDYSSYRQCFQLFCNLWCNTYGAAILVLHNGTWLCNACLFWLIDTNGIAYPLVGGWVPWWC